MGSAWPQGDYQQSIGFANALSQAIIREETIGSHVSGGSDEFRVAPLLEDESLELAGAPWAKEGIVKHKHHLEALGKRAKDRNWNEVFAVVEKGYLSLFSFSTKSMRNKSKGKVTRGVVGGGNWQENAESLGSFLLRQTIASFLPSPGYSKSRPHVWALSLPSGSVHLFQVGTPDIVKEFVSTANYWSAQALESSLGRWYQQHRVWLVRCNYQQRTSDRHHRINIIQQTIHQRRKTNCIAHYAPVSTKDTAADT